MADQQNLTKKWTKPILRQLKGAEADRARALIMERNGPAPEAFKLRKAS